MQEQINDIQKDVKEMKDALLGTEFNDNKGIVHQVGENTSFIKKAKKTNYIVIGLAMGLGVLKLGWTTILKFLTIV